MWVHLMYKLIRKHYAGIGPDHRGPGDINYFINKKAN